MSLDLTVLRPIETEPHVDFMALANSHKQSEKCHQKLMAVRNVNTARELLATLFMQHNVLLMNKKEISLSPTFPTALLF